MIHASGTSFFRHCLFLRHPLTGTTHIGIIVASMRGFSRCSFSACGGILSTLSRGVRTLCLGNGSPRLGLLASHVVLRGVGGYGTN